MDGWPVSLAFGRIASGREPEEPFNFMVFVVVLGGC
jgi:hypothetical protein